MTKEKIDSVKIRIELVNNLTKLRDNFRGTHLLEPVGENGWTHPYKHFSALHYYLLLTCFDILGSNNQFIPFSTWLNSEDCSAERTDILNKATGPELLDKIKSVDSSYNQIYGTTQGFKRFINVIISNANKTKLLESIQIRKISTTENKVFEYTPTETQKIKFLFQIRNSFTHAGESFASPSGGLFDDPNDGAIIDGVRKWGFYEIYRFHKESYYLEYSVRKWPSTLIEIIEDTIKAI